MDVPEPEQEQVATLGEVPVLVEDAVVREEVLPVDGLDAAVRADRARVREVAVEPRRPDERDDALARPRDLLDRVVRRADESGTEQEVFGRVAGDGELREDDEIGAGSLGFGQPVENYGAVAVEVADYCVQLRERESQGFRLTVTNLV